mmetsp:Transcript_21065/g.23447  ORF Transcript_21065/g.23447 Transcript_21065/m.23447 type:complete len:171 (+) Transcript_21065:2-514(+)
MTRGLNKDPEFYAEMADMPKSMRKTPWIEFEDFWKSEEEHEFFLHGPLHSEFRKFKAWIRKEVRENLGNEKSYEENAIEKFGDMFHLMQDYEEDYSRYNITGAENIPVLKYSWADFLDDKEKKEFKNELPEPAIPAEYIPMDKANKLELDREALEELFSQMKEKAGEGAL